MSKLVKMSMLGHLLQIRSIMIQIKNYYGTVYDEVLNFIYEEKFYFK